MAIKVLEEWKFQNLNHKKVLTLCVLAAFLWAALWPFDVLVRGRGIIRVEGHNIVIQHAEGGVLTKLFVSTGQVVKKDEKLAEVENLTVIEEHESALIAVRALETREQRLKAELAQQDFSPEVPKEPALQEIYSSEKKLYDARQKALNETINIGKNNLAQIESQVAELNSRIEDLGREMQLSNEHLKLLEPLVAKGAAAEAVLMQRRLEYQKTVSALNEARAKLPTLKAERDGVRLKLDMTRTEFNEDANKQLSEAQLKLEQARAQLVASEKRQKNSAVLSPVDGIVQQVAMPHVGAVLRPGEQLFEIAPSEVPLVADVKVAPQDRDRMWVGQNVHVRVAAASAYNNPTLNGVTTVISADTMGDDEKGRYYEVTINITDQPKDIKIFPGMSVETYAQAGQRTFLEYLFKPFLDGARVVFSE